MPREFRSAVIAVVVATLALGLAYPLAMTGAAQVLFPSRADGTGTDLIAQDFSKDDGLFQSRPSATEYSASATFFNNQGPNQRALAEQVRKNLRRYLRRERPYAPGLVAAKVPPDAVTTSASGVDPHISKANARIQANRVARKHGMSVREVLALVDDHDAWPVRSVNVVALNRALEGR